MEKGYKLFQATIQSDTGKHKLRVTAINKWSAEQLICAAEGCPGTAIKKIVELKPKPAYTVRAV